MSAPHRIREKYQTARDNWQGFYYDYGDERYWFFEGSETILNEEQLQQCIIIGDCTNGDELVFYPLMDDRFYVLPRGSEKIFWVKSDFSDLHQQDIPHSQLQVFFAKKLSVFLQRKSYNYSLSKDLMLAQFREKWGESQIYVTFEDSDQWQWMIIFFIPTIGGRVQISQDEQVTRTITRGENTYTIQGNGQRSLDLTIYCEDDSLQEVTDFLNLLETKQLVKWDKP